ncbi:hypothetical protein HX13_07795 [Chryseobacterium sp. P1-3]|uniref:Uncharacterized protein n=1 Tax=Chryseobacterium gallinarum TaxID=1324352 RepID=A0A0G3M735_CHRGL|nr:MULTISPECIES: hypothetical protein [Chryseobacterium]AKK72872.1 hypothetical protein OK18_09790 [Chryseobacterium gallinarum]KFF75120.1 hypothetical protein HX13_07795 [Chryseobacterium sp. P1-3]
MRILISIFIIFTVAIRPVLPLINYVVNYDYIVKNLCENKDVPQSTCKGKCYVGKELAKTEKQSNTSQTIKIAGLDVFLSNEILTFPDHKEHELFAEAPGSGHFNFSSSDYFSRVFHPPLA